MAVAKEGEVPCKHVAGVLSHDVLVDAARRVYVIVRLVAKGLNVAPLPKSFVVKNIIIWMKMYCIYPTHQLEIFIFSDLFFSSNTFFLCSGFE